MIRLCTDDDEVVKYWNAVDEELELDLDVLDDLTGEAKEVCAFSPWLNYGMPLHRLREWGCMNKLMDLLDEKALSASEMKELISLLLGEEDLPHPQIDFAAFDKALTSALERTPLVYDPLRKRREHWVNMRKLRSHYGGVSHCCVIC